MPEPIEDFNSEEGSGSEDEDGSDSDGSENDSNQVKPYQSLLEAFGASRDGTDAPRKRRKLDNANGHQSNDLTPTDAQHLQTAAEEEAYSSAPEQQEESADEDEVEGESLDFFDIHFDKPEEGELARRLKNVQADRWDRRKVPFGKQVQAFRCDPVSAHSSVAPENTSGKVVWKKKFQAFAESRLSKLDPTVQAVNDHVVQYTDVMFGGRTPELSTQLRETACLHALNHVFKTRDRVLQHNEKLAKQGEDATTEYRDQGFTRPKVLIVLPTKQSCVRYVNTILNISKPEQQENKKRFEETYVKDTDLGMDRPADYKELFEGDDDDSFRLGIKFTRKTVKFFSQFYGSDIILASPLGLRRVIERVDPKKKRKDSDFLSSIEIVIIDQADALLQQVWDHVELIFSHLNQQPKEAHDCDFSRVRNWSLDGNAAYLRQTLIFSAFLTPELNTVFSKDMRNCFGKLRFAPEARGAVQEISASSGLSIKQTFLRFNCPSPTDDPDTRFQFFQSSIVPHITRHPKPPDGCHGILIFIPSYFDFVRVRNFFATSTTVQSLSFGAISENHTPADPETRRARSYFLSGRHSVLLYSGRAHHFYRYMIKGVKRVIMYSLPDNPIFYEEIVGGFLGASVRDGKIVAHEASVRAVFSRWDALKLERIVGTARVGALMREKGGDTFDFV